jgi:REP element-mobilizing transposase RayT
MVRGFKSSATIKINQTRNNPRVPVWQRNYYEHIIRDEEDYQRIYDYILTNPIRWADDKLYMMDGPNLTTANWEL